MGGEPELADQHEALAHRVERQHRHHFADPQYVAGEVGAALAHLEALIGPEAVGERLRRADRDIGDAILDRAVDGIGHGRERSLRHRGARRRLEIEGRRKQRLVCSRSAGS